MRMCDYDIVSREFNCFSDPQMKRSLIKELDSYLENVFIIYDHEVTLEGKRFNVYVYNGDFLRPSFEKELLKKSEDIMLSIYSLRSSLMVPNNIVGEHCHARSIVAELSTLQV